MNRYGRGSADFDREPYFPSFALMLDESVALILKVNGERSFTRIGIIHLIRPSKDKNDESATKTNDIEDYVQNVDDMEAVKIADGSLQTINVF